MNWMAGRATRLRSVHGPSVAAGTGLWLVCLAVFGYLPGLAPPPRQTQTAVGVIDCFGDLGLGRFAGWCPDLGEPAGMPILIGLPELLVGSVVSELPGVGAQGGYYAVIAAAVGASLVCGFLLMRLWGVPRPVALGVPFAYLMSPSVVHNEGFGGTTTGFYLLPVYVYLAVRTMEAWHGDRDALIRWSGVWLVTAMVMVFTDGYSFIAGNLLIGVIWAMSALDRTRGLGRRLGSLAVWAGSGAAAALAYRLYASGDAYETQSNLEVFRAFGVDLAGLVSPTERLWWADATGVTRDVSRYWGDGSNIFGNYIGVTVVGLALGAVVWFVRRRGAVTDPVVAVVVAAGIAFVLSLGPALKVDEHWTADQEALGVPRWAMPADVAPQLPTQRIHASVPGIQEMRATHRWFLVTRFGLVVLAGFGVTALTRRKGVGWGAAIGLLAVVELLPVVPERISWRRDSSETLATLDSEVVAGLQRLVSSDELVLFLPARNDYMLNLLVPPTGARTYNVGGDKANQVARRSWPSEVTAAASAWEQNPSAESVVAVLDGATDAVILPHFRPDADARHWPPPAEVSDARRAAASDVAADPRLCTTSSEWFTVLRSCEV